MTSPRKAPDDIATLVIQVPEVLRGETGSLSRVAEPPRYAHRLFQHGLKSLGDLHGMTVQELLTLVPTTTANIRHNLTLLREAGIKIVAPR
jgi:hypothetical protein